MHYNKLIWCFMICKIHTKRYFVSPGRMSDFVLGWNMASRTDMCICLSNYWFTEHGECDLASRYCWSSQGTLQGSYYFPNTGGKPGSEKTSHFPKGTQLESGKTRTRTHNHPAPKIMLFWLLSFFPKWNYAQPLLKGDSGNIWLVRWFPHSRPKKALQSRITQLHWTKFFVTFPLCQPSHLQTTITNITVIFSIKIQI